MRPRTRVFVVVGAAAVAAVGGVLGATLLTSGTHGGAAAPATTSAPHAGAPPLALDLGVRTDPEAVALRRAEQLYDKGERAAAARIFARYRSPAAQVGRAFAEWPHGSVQALRTLAAAHPRDGLVQLHLGLALYWAGMTAAATASWRTAARVDPDSPAAVTADDLLHPNMPHGLPIFVTSFAPPASLARLSPPRQLARLEADARHGGVRAKLLYGVALQRLGHPLSAEREFVAAATLAPDDAEAQTAAAVGRFSKDDPKLAFSRLGPLATRFPHAPTVRFHLGLLLLWLDDVKQARRQFTLARKEGPKTLLGREAARFLARLKAIRTG